MRTQKTQVPAQNVSQSENTQKFDLMSLGIELDDALIQRLQKNLGIETIFSVAHRSAGLIKNKPHVPVGSIPEMAYRHVTESPNKSYSGTIKAFNKESIHTDNKLSMSILKDLGNCDSHVEARFRPQLDKLIETYRLMYSRSPERFVCTLMGRKLKSSDHGSDTVSRLVLKSRYLSEEDFLVMIQRVDGSAEPELVSALFRLLSADKHFGNSTTTRRKDIVDLWEFLTLLKTASNEARRSFDHKSSRLSTDVEFWRKSNHNLSMTSNTLTATQNNERYQTERARKLSAMSTNTRRHLDDPSPAPTANPTAVRKTKSGGHMLSVAQLLGQTESRVHPSAAGKSHRVKGLISSERINSCNVPTALNSPLKIQPPAPRRHFSEVGITREETQELNYNVFGSSQVGRILQSQQQLKQQSGNKSPNQVAHFTFNDVATTTESAIPESTSGLVASSADDLAIRFQGKSSSSSDGFELSIRRSQSAGRVRPSSTNTLRKEGLNETSVAAAMGTESLSTARCAPTPNKSREFSRSFLLSEGSLARNTRTGNLYADSVASALGVKERARPESAAAVTPRVGTNLW